MARKQAIFPEVNFVKGLVTETTALRFPENSCTETWDCVFDYTGRVTRRPGLDVETGYALQTVPAAVSTDAYTEYLWETVGIQGGASYFVVQRGSLLYFYNSQDTTDYSGELFQTIDLNDYVPVGSTADPSIYRCGITEGRGNLVVVNPAIDPFYVEYDASTDVLATMSFDIKYRDFAGLDDGLEINERVTASVTSLKTSNPEHYYNLLNQGWHHQNWLDEWDTHVATMPSNADTPSLFTVINGSLQLVVASAYISHKVSEQNNTPSPKGHFILSAGSPSRNDAMTDGGFTGATVTDASTEEIDLSGLTTISGGGITRPLALYDGDETQSTSECTILNASAYSGKTLSAGAAIYGARITIAITGTPLTTVQLYGRAGASPGSGTDGTLIGTFDTTVSHLGGTSSTFFIDSTDKLIEYDHVWIRTVGAALNVAELEFFTGAASFYRPSCARFYAGRVFYGGLPNENSSNSIYFTQILDKTNKYGQCYQKNDPTSPDFFDLLSDDGGVVVIPEMGTITELFSYQNSLIVLASNGVWLISGSNRGPFQASDYSVRKISSVGTQSGASVVDRRGFPVWWAEDGIYSVTFDAQYDTFQVVSLTEQTIGAFINAIPKLNRRYVKGAYDRSEDRMIWIYNDSAISTPADYYTYNKALLMDGQTNAFYPWTLGNTGDLIVRGVSYVRDTEATSDDKIKLIVEHTDGLQLTFAEFNDTTNWIDWETYGDDIAYESYFITAYKVRGDTQKFGQINYIFTFMEDETNASLYMQAIHEFTNDASSGRWSTPQQCYISTLNKDVQYRRLKVRGKGRAIQLKMYSEAGKPFTIIGWSTSESVNAEI